MRDLTSSEIRVIGALIEKKITTPDQYPLSLNALVNACNQKSSREPVTDLSEAEVQELLDGLADLNLVSEVSIGSRVKKYQHRFCNTEFSRLRLASSELAIICCLFLRGAQTPGELRSRCTRMHEFRSVEEVEQNLQDLMEREGGALVKKLPRQPGRRESRFMHLFSGEQFVETGAYTDSAPENIPSELKQQSGASSVERIAQLEEQVAVLQKEIELLKKNWEDLNT